MTDAAKIVTELAKWLPLAWQLRSVFGGNQKKALAALRKWELDERKKRDARLAATKQQ